MKLYITEQEYETHERRVEIYAKHNPNSCNYFPSEADIKKISERFPEFFEHILFIVDYCKPQTGAQREAIRLLRQLCGDNLEFVDKKSEAKKMNEAEVRNILEDDNLLAEME